MTRKDYELIARNVARMGEAQSLNDPDVLEAVETAQEVLALNLADEIAQTNPRFDRARFLKACGVLS